MVFVIASNNKKKVEELGRILKPHGITAKTAEELGYTLDEVEETGETFKENAELKSQTEEMDTDMGKYKSIESTLQNTLIVAQKTADEIR